MADRETIDKIKEKVLELHQLQLDVLLERLQDDVIEPQEMRLILDMVKYHNVGVENFEELVEAAKAEANGRLENIAIDENWSFSSED